MLAFALVLPMLAPQAGVIAADGEVCGYDGVTYDSETTAEEAGVDVSYDFACTNPDTESDLFEEKTEVEFAGMLIEIGSTDLPTTVIIRDNSDGHDYTVEISAETKMEGTVLSNWIPGDQVKVEGLKNENTENIEASELKNVSIDRRENKGVNGWITAINTETSEITYQWANVEHTFKYNDDTRFVVGAINPASASDLQINDRIRARLSDDTAKIVITLRRGEDLFMKIRTFRPNAELVRLDSTIVPTTIQVRMLRTPGIQAGDVNNLIGTEGTLITINITEDTKIVRKYFGKTGLDEFLIGDNLQIVGRVNDDGTVDAKLLKNNSIWQTVLRAHAGVVTEVNVDESYIMVNWTPVKPVTRKVLRERLNDDGDGEVIAQMVGAEDQRLRARPTLYSTQERVKILREKTLERIKNYKEKAVGVISRQLQAKKVQIERIRHENVKVKDLIERMPTKKMKVEINDDTTIIVAGNENATISEIANGDKVRVRGIRHASLPLISAETITVVARLPEIEEDLEVGLDEINEIVEEFVDEDEDDGNESDTEEVIEDEDDEEGNLEDEDDDDDMDDDSDDDNDGTDDDDNGTDDDSNDDDDTDDDSSDDDMDDDDDTQS